MHKVYVDSKLLYAREGELLSDVLIENKCDTEHICGGKGICKKCTVTVNGKSELSCQYKVESDIFVITESYGEIRSHTGIYKVPADAQPCYVLDIGTTTLALACVDGDLKTVTCTNPQRSFGADVMSRIAYCAENGVDALRDVLIDAVKELFSQLPVLENAKLYVSGNVTMLHIFSGEDCSSLGVAPYTPVFLDGRYINGADAGLDFIEKAEILPSVNTFVGADIVAGINYAGNPSGNNYNLLVDLGTNAEIVLYSENGGVCTSAAAGPCFEGGNISCGMSASNGAIYAYSEKECKTIGGVAPKGICATGLIDIIATLVSKGIIDETGYMRREQTEIAEGVFITQNDVRQFQLAKSAVYSAVVTLLEKMGITFDQVEKMYVSGGFSADINMENAVKVGLFPVELSGKFKAVSNSSLTGTVKYACERNNLSVITENIKYCDLSTDSRFFDLFIENMSFGN